MVQLTDREFWSFAMLMAQLTLFLLTLVQSASVRAVAAIESRG